MDIILATLMLLIFSPLMTLVFCVLIFSQKSPIFTQKRIGRNGRGFNIFKFRTMTLNAPSLPTHLISKSNITPLGAFLRKTKIDELPQLFNVILGDMSFVGPRPCLSTQSELINLRQLWGLDFYSPGLTGLAQIHKIDMSKPKKLVAYEFVMMSKLNILKYFKYILATPYYIIKK